jgi:excisionase family DNA binding protein
VGGVATDRAIIEVFAGGSVMEEKFLTVQQVSDILQVPIGWVYARTRERGPNRIPHRKVGKYVRFIEAEVRDWLDSQRRGWQRDQ